MKVKGNMVRKVGKTKRLYLRFFAKYPQITLFNELRKQVRLKFCEDDYVGFSSGANFLGMGEEVYRDCPDGVVSIDQGLVVDEGVDSYGLGYFGIHGERRYYES